MQDTHACLAYAHPDFLHSFLLAGLINTQGVHVFPVVNLTNTQLMSLQESLSVAILHDVHSSAPFGQLHPVLLQTLADFPSIVEH